METIGSQKREKIEKLPYRVLKWLPNKEVILRDDNGKKELWIENDHFAGYVIEINHIGYEFVRTIK